MTFDIQAVWPAELALGEGPSWHAPSGRFLWVDVLGQAVHAWHPSTGERHTWHTPERIGWLIARSDGDGFVAGFHSGFVRLWLEPTLRWEHLGSPHPDSPNTRMNDAKADCYGRIWAGSMNHVDTSVPDGQLVRLDADCRFTVLERGIHIANGPAIAVDGSWMLHTDSYLNTVYRYDLHRDGSIAAKSVWRVFAPDEGTPDGMTWDAQGHVWIAFWGGGCIRQFTAQAELLQTIALPAPQITSMAFGGSDLGTLLVTSARVGLDAASLQQHPLSGACFTLRPGVHGLPPATFGHPAAR